MSSLGPLAAYPSLLLRQRRELAELFGYESRNKYEIADPNGTPILYAAEQGKGIGAMFMRQLAGHWRSFEIHVFDNQRNVILRALHPFRWFFQHLDIVDSGGRLVGALEQRFAIFTKSFDVHDAQGRVVMEVRSPVWRPWTFTFTRGGRDVAVVRKRWGGLLREAFTDADSFQIEYAAPELTPDERGLVLCAGIFIDLQYFEAKAQSQLGSGSSSA